MQSPPREDKFCWYIQYQPWRNGCIFPPRGWPKHLRYCYRRDTFKRSKFFISTNFHKILRVLNQISQILWLRLDPEHLKRLKKVQILILRCIIFIILTMIELLLSIEHQFYYMFRIVLELLMCTHIFNCTKRCISFPQQNLIYRKMCWFHVVLILNSYSCLVDGKVPLWFKNIKWYLNKEH